MWLPARPVQLGWYVAGDSPTRLLVSGGTLCRTVVDGRSIFIQECASSMIQGCGGAFGWTS